EVIGCNDRSLVPPFEELARRIQASILAAASHGRDVERIGPFVATFNREDANPFLNYAVPDEGAAPSRAEIEALADAYRARARRRGGDGGPARWRSARARRRVRLPDGARRARGADLRPRRVRDPVGGAPRLAGLSRGCAPTPSGSLAGVFRDAQACPAHATR